jgi:hypothetical protein
MNKIATTLIILLTVSGLILLAIVLQGILAGMAGIS